MLLSKNARERRALLLFLVPSFIIILVSQAYPLLFSFSMSFQDWALSRSLKPQGFVGLQNYVKAFQDPIFVNAFRISLMFCLVATTLEIFLGFLIAYFTVGHSLVLRLSRTILILPMVIAPVANGTIWRMILNPQSGLLNQLLGYLGINGPNWLGVPRLALL
jgi:ABC-type sugar transport system permease subunit